MAGIIGSILGGPLIDGVAKVISILKGKNSPEAIAAAQQLETLQAQWSAEFQMAQLQQATAQIDVNKAEASNQSLFVAGWRPAVGWTCAFGLAYQYLFSPIGTWIAALLHHPVAAPSLDLGSLMTLLLGMLGMGALRSYDKAQGTASGH